MQPTHATQESPFIPLCAALDTLESIAHPANTPARFALRSMTDVVDQGFQVALALAEGRDVKARDVQRQLTFVTAKLLEVSQLLGLPENSSARRCLALIKWEG
jgi:hypothetical protein